MTEYAVFTCRRTQELLLQAREQSFAAWAPVILVRKATTLVDPVTKEKRTGISKRVTLAMPGYMFVPFNNWSEFLHWAPKRFGVAIHRISSGDAQAKKDTYEAMKLPAKVNMAELKEMERVCRLANDIQETFNNNGVPVPRLEVGDAVTITGHPFIDEGTTATVTRCKPTGFVRVRLQNVDKYMDISRAYLKNMHER